MGCIVGKAGGWWWGRLGHSPFSTIGSCEALGKSFNLLVLSVKRITAGPIFLPVESWFEDQMKLNTWKHFGNWKVLFKYQGLLFFLNPAIPLPSPLKEQKNVGTRSFSQPGRRNQLLPLHPSVLTCHPRLWQLLGNFHYESNKTGLGQPPVSARPYPKPY